jgi:hypothetical protein
MSSLRPLLVGLLACLGLAACTRNALSLEFSKSPGEGADENAILASGKVEPDDGFRLQVYVSKLPPRTRQALYLDSTGGSVQGAMATGRVVHELKIRTYVTGTSAKCLSACTYIFLAGRDGESGKPYRVKGSANRLGFHNFVPVLQDKEFGAKDAANVIARAQKTIYDMALYFEEIDADLELLGFGLKQKEVYNLPNEDALRHGVHVLDVKSNELVSSELYLKHIRR